MHLSGQDIYYVGPSKAKTLLVLMTDSDQERALKECHDDPAIGGYRGMTISQRKVLASYYWSNVTDYIQTWVCIIIFDNLYQS